MPTLSRQILYPIWAHAEFVNGRDEVAQLYQSLNEADVVQINARQDPLEVDEITETHIDVISPETLEAKRYRIKPGDGQKYGLYLHREASKTGIGQMAVIYRSDGSTSRYSVDEIETMAEQGDRFNITWETTETTTRVVNPGKPQDEKQDEFRRLAKRGNTVDDVDGLVEDTEFKTLTKTADNLLAPTNSYPKIPAGTAFFHLTDDELDPRRVVPLDVLEQIEIVE